MYLNVAINLNNDFNPRFKNEDFKYNICVLCSKVILQVSPNVVKDIFEMRAYFEMQSYVQELKRYRPAIRIGTIQKLIKSCRDPERLELLKKIKRSVIRDWYKLILWYVRLRRASRVNKADTLGKSGWYHK